MASIETGTAAGPASYATGGFVITTGLAAVDAFTLRVTTPGANLPASRFRYTRNAPGAGQVTVQVMRHTYDKTGTALGAVSGLPAGVTAAATSGQTYDANTTHVHTMDHDHAAATSGAHNVGGGGNVTGAATGQQPHTHSFDPPNFTGNTGAGSSHTHTLDTLYDHSHALTNTETDLALSELAAATNLSGASFFYRAVDE